MLALGSTNFNTSTGDLVLGVILAFVFGFIGYRTSHRYQTIVGVTPWRIPSIVWAAICFFLQPIGVIIEWVAEFTTRPAMTGAQPGPMAASVAPSTRAVPAVTEAPQATVAPPPRYPGPSDEQGRSALFGWYRDVTGRHELRYWDGKHWSALVSDAGVTTNDPIDE
jgi:hypothetical protein